MSPRPAKFSQADVARVLKAARAAGMQARIDLTTGTVEIAEDLGFRAATQAPMAAPRPSKMLIP